MARARIRFLPFLLASLFLSASAEPDVTKRYDFEQATIVIEKKIKNASMESTTIDTVYLGEWGWSEVRYSHQKQDIRMLDKTTEFRTVSIMEKEWVTSYDPEKRTGVRTRNPFYQSAGNLSDQQEEAKGGETTRELETTSTGKGTEVIAGRSCEVVETRTGGEGVETVTTTWIWKRFVMRSITRAAGTEITEQVLMIDEGTGVRPELLKVPDDVTITDPSPR